MNAIQLEFNFEEREETDERIPFMQLQINAMNESMGKMRRRMFAELSAIKKQVNELENENTSLKEALFQDDVTIWDYEKKNCLFDVRKYQGEVC